MKITMNIYVSNIGNKGFDIKEEVIKRFEENDYMDLYYAVANIDIDDDTEYEKTCDMLNSFIDNASIDELEKYIKVDENSLEIDQYETEEWGCKNGIAYSVAIDFDIDRILNK